MINYNKGKKIQNSYRKFLWSNHGATPSNVISMCKSFTNTIVDISIERDLENFKLFSMK